ncbi:MAG: ribbon-helix-helix domain-containing protein [Candidatus Flexifilum sp.]
MKRDDRYAARIAFRLPQALYQQLERWAEEEDRPLANLVYTLVKQAAAERERRPGQSGSVEGEGC